MDNALANLARLERRETRAHECLDVAVKSWVDFVDEINAIHTEQDWKAKAPTWKAYLEAEFLPKLSYGYDRLYQLQAAQPFASAIEKTTGVVLNERQARLVKSLGYETATPLAAELVVHAKAAADFLEQPLKPKHIMAAHSVINERLTTGTISLEGESIAINNTISLTHQAVIQESIEANKREKQKIVDGSKRRALTFTPELILVGDEKRVAFPKELPISTLLGKKITVYIEEAA